MRPHFHTPDCIGRVPPCSREWDVDPETATGSYRIVARKGYGNRGKHDKPRWWPFALIAYKAAVQLLTLLGVAWLARAFGWKPELP